jgi:hypothetical protein
MYDIENLINKMIYFKESTNNIKMGSPFISIYRTYPITKITVEMVKHKTVNGDIITMSDNIYKANISCIYKYNEETINIILDWQEGYNLISDINKKLILMSISDIKQINKIIEEDKEK